MLLGGGNLVYRKKKADGVSKEHGEFEETVRECLKIQIYTAKE
jgi:hypothetical protein